MSSTVSRAMDPASPPTVPSNTSFFFSWSFRMRSSIVFSKHAVQCSAVEGKVKVKVEVEVRWRWR